MSEYLLAEKRCIDELAALGWSWMKPSENEVARDGFNQVILKDVFKAAIARINGIDADTANQVYADVLNIRDNQEWTKVLRGEYSRTVAGEAKKRTIRLIDFVDPANNTFTVTNQFRVQAEKNRIPDVVLFVNGIPLVVIEAKTPLSAKDKTGEAFEQIKLYENEIPRLFYSNLFNIVTDGAQPLLYGATGSPSPFWGFWRDPYPKVDADFVTPLAKGLYCLCEPSRLLELLAHFVVFEVDPDSGKTIKKICRYQQYRAVNKLFDRASDGHTRKGLIWHTQGSGKSLTMVYAALKLKQHLTSAKVFNPNLLVLTDRVDLDDQISKTFVNCGLPNPISITSTKSLMENLNKNTMGLVLLSTIQKFEGSETPIPDSENWIVLVDECHRTQEKNLGAYLRATMPKASFFGFTGTPVKKGDRDTYNHFSEAAEGYLDKYGIDDAVADGATVPIRYTSRKTEWQVDPEKMDILFDQWFAHESDEVITRLKERGVSMAELAKHPKRVELITYDIWTHFKQFIQPDGLKAQIVGIDREAVILYKRGLDRVIAEDFIKQGMAQDEAEAKAAAMSACVFSSAQNDEKPSEDTHIEDIRAGLREYNLDKQAEKDVIKEFCKKDSPLSFLIVCNKLLTGFDAQIEAVMYLDNPLKEHNLLQAIARTNRVYNTAKQYGLIVDYIGITKRLDDALESYRSEDVAGALRDLDGLRDELKSAFAEVKPYLKVVKRAEGARKDELKGEFDALIQSLGTEDEWLTFKRKAKKFIRCYEALSPDPEILEFTADLKWVVGFIAVATQAFEERESIDLKDYSHKIREMLHTHLDVTGISTICKVRHITDPEFWEDFQTEGKSEPDIKTAAIRKGIELKKVLTEKVADNPLRFGPFSERVLTILKKFQEGQMAAADALSALEQEAKDLEAEEKSHIDSGMNARAYAILRLVEGLEPDGDADTLKAFAAAVDALYASDDTAPKGWQTRDQLKKELRQQVRALAYANGLASFKEVSVPVEEYAVKNYAKFQ